MSSRKVPLHLHRPGRRPHHPHLHSFYTNTLFTPTTVTAETNSCTNQLLHKPTFTQTRFYTPHLSCTYANQLLHKPGFTRTTFCTDQLLQQPTFTPTSSCLDQLQPKTAWWTEECRRLLNTHQPLLTTIDH